ncbi:MAG: ABC transporter ATP-binding protein [Deltaproteobacteria bacterium]|nr:ABC transporter ATP-binding protein [Deltaproteobacteria bacterium]
MISIRALERRFGAFALGPLSLEIGRGDYWVLLGPSGAGKSMLLHLLAGVFKPDAGVLCVDDRDVTSTPPEERRVGLVFQQSALFPHLSVTDNLAYALTVRGVTAAERRRRTDEIVSALGIGALLHRPVATLSGGEAQKVAIGRALAGRPQLLLLDEPLGPIDHNARLELQEELKRVHRTFGLTTLHVTHSRDEAFALGSHLAILQNGRIVQAGAADAVQAAPRCSFVALFLGLDAAAGAPRCQRSCLTTPGSCDHPAGA